MSDTIESHEVDVAIVGGGIQGLWLLNDLTTVGYRTVLLEKHTLGGAQSLHSHGFIHRGYSYTKPEMARGLRQAHERWSLLLAARGLTPPPTPAYYAFASRANAGMWCDLWAGSGLFPAQTELLPFMAHGLIRRLYRTTESWIEVEAVTRALAAPHADAIYRAETREILFDARDQRVLSLLLSTGEAQIRVVPRAVILAAGAGNLGLLNRTGDPKVQNRAAQIHRERHSLMLVIRGNHCLPDVAMVIPDLWLFIVPRRDENNEVVWLVSMTSIRWLSRSGPLPRPTTSARATPCALWWRRCRSSSRRRR